MAISATTLSGAITSSQTSFGVASATGINVPNFQQAAPGSATITWLYVDQELMLVTNVVGTVVSVVRGVNGTAAVAHASGGLVQIGQPADFVTQNEYLQTSVTSLQVLGATNQPAVFLTGTADALTGAAGFFVVKTGSADSITIPTPTAAMEGNIVEVWSDTAFAHTITCATTVVAAGQALKTTVTFPAFRGAGCMLRACNLAWHLVGNGGVAAAGSCTLS